MREEDITMVFAAILSLVPWIVLAGEGGSTVSSALTTAFSGVVDDVLGLITSMLPVVLPILSAIMVITIGIKVFKKITNRSSS